MNGRSVTAATYRPAPISAPMTSLPPASAFA